MFLWIILFFVAEAFLTAGQFFVKKKDWKPVWRVVIIIAKLLLAIAFAALVMAGPVFLRPVQPFLFALYVVLLPDALADAVYSIAVRLKKSERKVVPYKILSLALGILFCVYGTVKMQVITPRYHTYTSAKLTEEHKFIFVADMHVGSSQSLDTTKKAIAAMKAEKPDFIILGGDITDDYTTKEEMEATFEAFGALNLPIYYIYGNHEVVQHAKYIRGGLPYTSEELLQTITQNGISVVADEYIQIAPDLELLGRQDMAADSQRKAADTLPNPNPDLFLLTADHQPVDFAANCTLGTDLQVSGHTHAGQLFPLKALFALIGGKVEGDYHEGDATMNVSSGMSGWRAPLRTESHCHFEVITVKPE